MAGYSWEQNDDNDSFGLDVYDFYNDNTTFYNLNLANKMDCRMAVSPAIITVIWKLYV